MWREGVEKMNPWAQFVVRQLVGINGGVYLVS